jgi:hypothetical protein
MLNLFPGRARDCEGVSRRSFLQVGLGMQAAARAAGKTSTGNCNVILVWTRGGTSHHDTFDPKPDAPVNVRGEYGVIDTAIPGVKFTEIVPTFAKEMKRFALLRGWNPKNGSHGVADQYVMSGRPRNVAVRYPTIGSVVSYHKGFKSALPPFIQVGTEVDRRFGGGQPGILGLEHGAFEIAADPSQPNFVVRDITMPSGVTSERLDRRRKMLTAVDKLQRTAELQPAAYDALDEHYKTALNMITAPETKGAFEIGKETDKLRDEYGRNKFGQSLLLSRRLIEAGVRFVTVTDGGWDTHANNFKSLKNKLPYVDQGLPVLVRDLADRGLLDNTLVCWLTDFGRTPKINSASGRDHWATSGFGMFAGGGIPGGQVLGATDDEGGFVTKDEYFSEDVATMIYAKAGIPTDLMVSAPDGRPIRLLEGKPIKEWL